MSGKLNLVLLCGGKSPEHEVSLQSTLSVLKFLDKSKYRIYLVGIGKDGVWHLYDPDNFLSNANDPAKIKLASKKQRVTIVPSPKGAQIVSLDSKMKNISVDVVFPAVHGSYGEDGSLQGMLEMVDVPFVGAGVLGSAIGMDKDVTKRLLRDSKIPVGKFLVFHENEKDNIDFERVKEEVGIPMFCKPACMGSSVGVSKIKDKSDFDRGVSNAFKYDNKIIIEEFIDGREIECSVLGNEEPVASILGEIVPSHEFYSYEAKYLDKMGATLRIPAELKKETEDGIRKIAIKAYKVLCCEGMARVDFFLRKDAEIFVNEINTIPGFTEISMYPKLWEASGISFTALLDKLINLAIERHKRKKKLRFYE